MPTFVYTARDPSGQVATGQVEAEDLSRAAERLREMGLWITQLRPGGASPGARGHQRSFAEEYLLHVYSGVSLRDLAVFYRQFAALIHAGISLYQTLDTLTRETQNRRLREVIRQIAAEVLKGQPLAEAMDRYPWLFSDLQRHMIRAAEIGGLLESVLARLADYLENEWSVRTRIKQRLLYPFLVFLALIFIPDLPILVLSGPAPYFIAIWHTWGIRLLVVLLVYLTGRFLMKYEWFRAVYDDLQLAVPIIGPLVRKMTIARFARAMAALTHAGVWLNTGLRSAADACANARLRRLLHRVAPAIERGVSLSETMRMTGFFPPMFLGMVQTGEQAGSIEAMFDKAAEYYEREAEHATIQLVIIFGVVLLLGMAYLVLQRVLQFYLGYFSGIGGAAD